MHKYLYKNVYQMYEFDSSIFFQQFFKNLSCFNECNKTIFICTWKPIFRECNKCLRYEKYVFFNPLFKITYTQFHITYTQFHITYTQRIFFRNFIKSNLNQIAFTIFRFIWNQTDGKLVWKLIYKSIGIWYI